jgi:hypothetical protein
MITYNHPFVTESSLHTFTCFASDVEEFRRGFPKIVPTNMGNKMPFVGHSKKVNTDGDIEYVRYRQTAGCIELVVYND